MKTSKLSSLLLLLGLLILMSMFSFPVQAQTAQPRNEQPNSQFGKPPTNTKKAKSPPRKTATPRPANTATKAPTRQNTAVPTSSTSVSQPTEMNTTGTPASTSNVPATSAVYSATPTPQGMNTIVAQQTKTAGASFLTSTSLALTFSPTPTNFGAPTATLTFTPNALELTATALALSTPLADASPTTATFSPTPTTVILLAVSRPEIPVTAKGLNLYIWIAAIAGGVVLLTLFYLLYKEWSRFSTRGW